MKKMIALSIILMFLFGLFGTACSQSSGSIKSGVEPAVRGANEDERAEDDIVEQPTEGTAVLPTATAATPTLVPTPAPTLTTIAAPTVPAGPVAPCKLPAAAFSNVGLSVPRQPGFTPSTGTVNAVVLFTDFEDAPARETPEETFARVSPGAPDFFRQVSYGRMTLELNPHLMWLRLGLPSTHYGEAIRSGDGHRDFIQEAVKLADDAVDFSSADLVIVLANPDATAIPYGPAFGAAEGFKGIEADGVSIPSGVTSGADLKHWDYLWLNHEMGHTMTLPDLYPFEHDGSSADSHRFVGTFGLMGLISGHAPELFAFERWMLGWLDDAQIVCHTEGETTVALSPIEQTGGTKAVVVPTGKTSALVVESRRAIGFDTGLVKEGALVYAVDTATQSGYGPIQVLPILEGDPKREQSPLAEGESVTRCGVTISNTAGGENGDIVRVTVAPQNPCVAEAGIQPDPCADVPIPKEAAVTVRFVNDSASSAVLYWVNQSSELHRYQNVSAGGFVDQETFAGHRWLLQEENGRTLLEYTATESQTQCVRTP